MTPSAPARAIARTWVGRLTPNPTATGTGRDSTDVANQGSDRRRQRGPGTRHADQRDAIEEATAARRDRGASGRRGRRRDEVDDRQAGRTGDGLERRALVRGQVGHDQTGGAGPGQPARDGLPVATADDLVGVAHRHERQVRPSRADPLDQAERPLERRARGQRHARGALERGAIGQRIGVRQADLEQVGAGIRRGERDLELASASG